LIGDEYSELAELWSASAPADDARELERLALRTPRMGRVVQWGELAAVAMLAVLIGASIVWNLGPATLLTGGMVMLLLAWSAWRRHHLGNIALLIEEGDRLSFVRSTLRAKEAELNRSAIGLALVLPGIVLTMLLGYAIRHQGRDGDLGAFLLTVLATPRGMLSILLLLAAVLLLSLSHRRLRGELGRLRQLRDDFAEESRRDDLSEQ
jgi:hypothetical protein